MASGAVIFNGNNNNLIPTADRLVPGDVLVLYTKMQVLDGLNKYEECYAVCNELIEKHVKVLC